MAAKKKTAKKKVAKKKVAKKKVVRSLAGQNVKGKKELLPQHKKFCDILRTSKSWVPSEAYMKCYPNIKTKKAASAAAYKILARVEVIDYLNEKQELMEERVDCTQEDILKDLMELRDMCMGRSKVPVTVADKDGNIITGTELQFNETGAKGALELLGKNKKMFTDKIEHGGRVTANFNFNLAGKK